MGSTAPGGMQGVGALGRYLTATQGSREVPTRAVMCQALGLPSWQRLSLGTGMCSSYWRPPCPAALGQEGCSCCPLGLLPRGCSCPLYLFCPWGPQPSSGCVLPSVCDYRRTAQPQTRGSPAETRGSVSACSQGIVWPLGWILPLSKAIVADVKSQSNRARHQYGCCEQSMMNCWSDLIPPGQMMSPDF